MPSKRSISPDSSESSIAKRPRLEQPLEPLSTRSPIELGALTVPGPDVTTEASQTPSAHHITRCHLQRSISLALSHVGFASATTLAMESFTNVVEEYLERMIREVKAFALSARREHPTPVDFNLTLDYFNLPMWSLRPHLRNPIPRRRLAAKVHTIEVPAEAREAMATLPLLTPDLSGSAEKQSLSHIPAFLPDFPSRHTYRCTPAEDTSARDSKKIREEAARTAQEGEDALRRLVRASKVRKRKEVKSLVERDSEGRERFRLWESCMRRFTEGGTGGGGDQVEITEQSMIVHAKAKFSRREVSRQGKRAVTGL